MNAKNTCNITIIRFRFTTQYTENTINCIWLSSSETASNAVLLKLYMSCKCMAVLYWSILICSESCSIINASLKWFAGLYLVFVHLGFGFFGFLFFVLVGVVLWLVGFLFGLGWVGFFFFCLCVWLFFFFPGNFWGLGFFVVVCF